jgi:AraC-like DNA-binding protein
VDDLLESVDETMVKNLSDRSERQGSSNATIRRPITGGTNDGRRPVRYTYWRVGYGDVPSADLPFVIERAGEYHCRPDYLSGSIDHPSATQVYYHLEGEALFEQPNRTRPIKPGNVLIIPFGHVGYYRSEAGMKYHWLSLGRHWPRERGERPSVQLLPLSFDDELADRFIEIRELLILQNNGYPLRAIGSFYNLLARIEELSSKTSDSLAQSPYPEAVRNAIMFLRERDTEPYDAAATAGAVNLSQSHLRALFEKWVGESPRQFHTRSRIERAARLLRAQDLSVSAAGMQVGYGDARHFSRVFKAVTGFRPRDWRRSEYG